MICYPGQIPQRTSLFRLLFGPVRSTPLQQGHLASEVVTNTPQFVQYFCPDRYFRPLGVFSALTVSQIPLHLKTIPCT